MGNTPPISGTSASTASVPPQPVAERSSGSKPVSAEDHVEISELAQSLSTLEPASDIRVEKVQAIREAILNGTYLTEDKIDATIDRLIDDLRSSG